MGADPVVVLYASISVLNWMRAATGSQCKETKRGVTRCAFRDGILHSLVVTSGYLSYYCLSG